MTVCKCGSHAINHHCHGRDGTDGDLCDVCYWRKRAERPAQPGYQALQAAHTRLQKRYGELEAKLKEKL